MNQTELSHLTWFTEVQHLLTVPLCSPEFCVDENQVWKKAETFNAQHFFHLRLNANCVTENYQQSPPWV